ncbi:hypothetical protein L484_017827 [Morus notabilis]|uniref:B3 domain-containing protein n=1 Tax=Morus notabilis TaxID=981085 RepID=W9R0E4_9ROSA|nr:B3 domain-containing protein At5g38490 [Morus notabilis]EXB50289.1 hypothetical protein L484_017827 [Morus notabilis]
MGKNKSWSITEKGFSSNGMDVLAYVCAYALDRELHYKNKEPYQVPYLVDSLKYTDPVLNIPKKMRNSDGRRRRRSPLKQPQHDRQDQTLAMITTDDHRDLSVSDLQSKKRLRFDDFHVHEDYQKSRILSEQRCLEVGEDYYEGKRRMTKKSAKCNASGLKRRRSKVEEDYEEKVQSMNCDTSTGRICLEYFSLLPLKKLRLFDEEDDHDNRKIIQSSNDAKNEKKKKAKKTTNNDQRRSNIINGSSKRKKVIVAGPNPAPEISTALKEKIVREFGEYSDFRLLIQKSLYKTDLTPGNNRLSIPLGSIAGDDFLTDEEKRKLESRKEDDSKHLEGIQIDFFEPNLEFKKSNMTLKKWDYASSSSYMLSGHWNNVVERNGLKEEDIVQIWFFRRREGNNPSIALVNLSQRNVSSSSFSSTTEPRSDLTE